MALCKKCGYNKISGRCACNFQSRSGKSPQAREKSAQRAQRRDRNDQTSPHNDGIKSNRNPKRSR